MNAKHILITGASGLIGTRLTELLLQRKYIVTHLSREKQFGTIKTFVWNTEHQTLEAGAFDGVDAIVNLAGAGIADKPWTDSRKKIIVESRTKSVQLLFNELTKKNHQVKTFVSASAMGFYGMHDLPNPLKETDEAGTDFLADVTTQWEHEIDKVSELFIRTVKLRISVVLSDRGGALEQMAKPIKFFVGAPLGSGHQMVSWIHLDDLCNMFIKAIEDDHMRGAYNAVAPEVVSNETLTRGIAKHLHRPIIVPRVPEFAVKLLLGEMAEMVLRGSRLSDEKIREAGFTFQYETVEKALQDIYN